MDAWVSRVLFDEGSDDIFPSVVAVSVSEAVIEHAMVICPDGLA